MRGKILNILILSILTVNSILFLTNDKFCSARRVKQGLTFAGGQELDEDELKDVVKDIAPKIKGIVLDCDGTLMRIRDLKIDENMVKLLESLINKGIHVAILTTLPLWSLKLRVLHYFSKDYAKQIFIGHKKDIVNFMEKKGLNPEELIAILDEPLGRDRLLVEKMEESWIINVGRYFENLPENVLTPKIKGPEATKMILEIIINRKK